MVSSFHTDNPESSQTHARLDHLRAARQQQRAAESTEARRARPDQLRARQQQRLTTETEEERQARLNHLRVRQQQRLTTETAEERQARLDQLRVRQQQRRAAEIAEERQAHLDQLRVRQQQRRSAAAAAERQGGLNADHHQHHWREQEINPQAPLLDQQPVRTKLARFHANLVSLQFRTCLTCAERFPNLNVVAVSEGITECRRCNQDKRVPKLFSTANNMNPGPLPSQLQVCF